MAKINSHKSTVFFDLISMLFLVLMVIRVESLIVGSKGTSSSVPLTGESEQGRRYAIAQQYNLTLDVVYSINPNVNCDDLSIGQWLFISGEWI
ncbi:hypothetical protein ACJRO7_033893 [Eucalyptus globulus]|uniref:LysM domain-containing protein n=1 Tax=Eucalyptus globulus TaxID=34317 RepID=A0ABD3J4V5_EUCGL